MVGRSEQGMGAVLRRELRGRGLSQAAFAEVMGVTRQYVWQLCNRAVWSVAEVIMVRDLLGMQTEHFIPGRTRRTGRTLSAVRTGTTSKSKRVTS